MDMRLELHDLDRLGNGPKLSESDKVIRYEVFGMPMGERAWIANIDYRWQILRANDSGQGPWIGNNASAELALTALEKEVNDQD